MDFFLGALSGALLAGIAAVFLLRACRATRETEVAVLNERLASRDAEIDRLTENIFTTRRALDEAAALNTELKAQHASLGSEVRALETAREQLGQAFQALSAQALQTNNESFLQLATQALGKFQQGAQGELEKKQQAIGELVAPVKQTLEKLEGRLAQVDKDREGSYQSVSRHLESMRMAQEELRRETGNLVKALRQPAARGRWGELQLRRVVEMAGMVAYCDFEEQVTVGAGSEAGASRPDLVVRLPGGKNIVVDAKTPLSAYLDAIESEDESVRQQGMANHARQVRDHMVKLSRRGYQGQFESTPDLVVLFLPGEMFFSAALQHDPKLIEFGAGANVILATPTILITLLKAVSYGWQQEALARNAAEISELGRELFERIGVLAAHWKGVGKSLGAAVSAYNQSVGSLESRVLVSARKLKEKGVIGAKEIEEVLPVEVLPRLIQVVEMKELEEVL